MERPIRHEPRSRFVRRSVLAACLALAASVGTHGCIATTVATIAVVSGKSGEKAGHTATVELDVPPDEVWATQMRILERRPDITIESVDRVRREVKVVKGKNTATSTLGTSTTGKTLLKVQAKAGDEAMSDPELAERIVASVLRELDVAYRIQEERPPAADRTQALR